MSTSALIVILSAIIYCILAFAFTLLARSEHCFFHTKNISIYLAVVIFLSVYANLMLSILTSYGDSGGISDYTNFLISHPLCEYLPSARITYPPVFCYVYLLLGKFATFLHIPIAGDSRWFLLLMKLPCFFVEYIMAGMFYQCTRKKYTERHAIPILIATVCNPAYLLLTAYISQVDALYAFFVVLTVYLLYQKKLIPAYFAFATAILFKFQAVFITPVVFLATLNDVILHDFEWKNLWKHLLGGFSAIGYMILCYIPFLFDFSKRSFIDYGITDNFTNSIASYGLATQNAPNLWYLLGYNFKSEYELLGPFTCTTWYHVFIVLLVFLCIGLFWIRREDRTIYPLLAALLVSGTVCFAVRIMPRYLYAAAGLTIFAFILKWTKKRFICMISMNLCLFLINASDYLLYPISVYTPELIVPRLISLYTLVCFVIVIVTILSLPQQIK